MASRLRKTISSIKDRAHSYTIAYKKPDSTTLTASKGAGKALTDLVAPLVHCFIGHINLPRSKQFLDIAVAQGKMVVTPEGVTDDCVGIEVTWVWGAWCCHQGFLSLPWLPWLSRQDVHDGVINHDRVLLVCSKNFLTRLGVLNEIERVLEREAKEGGGDILIPVTFEGHIDKVVSVLRN